MGIWGVKGHDLKFSIWLKIEWKAWVLGESHLGEKLGGGLKKHALLIGLWPQKGLIIFLNKCWSIINKTSMSWLLIFLPTMSPSKFESPLSPSVDPKNPNSRKRPKIWANCTWVHPQIFKKNLEKTVRGIKIIHDNQYGFIGEKPEPIKILTRGFEYIPPVPSGKKWKFFKIAQKKIFYLVGGPFQILGPKDSILGFGEIWSKISCFAPPGALEPPGEKVSSVWGSKERGALFFSPFYFFLILILQSIINKASKKGLLSSNPNLNGNFFPGFQYRGEKF